MALFSEVSGVARKPSGPRPLSRARSGWIVIVAAAVAGVAVMPAAAAGSVGGPAAGTVSTVAGGVGGPAKATGVALTPCSLTSAAGSVYAGAGRTVRKVSSTGGLTTPAGTGVAERVRVRRASARRGEFLGRVGAQPADHGPLARRADPDRAVVVGELQH